MKKTMFKQILRIVTILSLIPVPTLLYAQNSVPYLDYGIRDDTVLFEFEDQMIDYVDLKQDDQGDLHLLFLKRPLGEENPDLYVTHQESGSFVEPVFVYSFEFEPDELTVRLDDELTWHVMYRHYHESTNHLYYFQIKNYSVENFQTLYEDIGHLNNFSLKVDDKCDAHCTYHTTFTEKNYEMRFIYCRTSQGIFKEIINKSFTDFTESHTELYIENERSLFCVIILGGDTRVLEIADDEIVCISDPFMNLGAPDSTRILMDHSNNLHVFKSDGHYPNPRLRHYISADRGRTFIEKQIVTEIDFEFDVLGEPMLLPDDGIAICHNRRGLSYPNFIGTGIFQLDRGYGFGNGEICSIWQYQDFSHGTTAPSVIMTPDYRLLAAGVYTDVFYDYLVNIQIAEYTPLTFTEPQVKLTLPYTHESTLVLTGHDQLRVCLDLYNPTDKPVDMELVIVNELDILPDYCFYISDEDGFPTFQTDYASFTFTMPPDTFFQNVPIVKFPLEDLTVINDQFYWTWYAGIFDPVTGELLDYSFDRCKYTLWDDW